MLHIAEIDMVNTVKPRNIDVFPTKRFMGHLLTYHTVLKPSSGAVIIGWGMLFSIPFLVDWNKVGEH